MYEYGGGGFHCVYFDDKDFEIFKKRQLTAVTCPASNLKLASGIAPLKRFVEEGIPVAIGTDGPASNNSLDMFKEMFLASALAKGTRNGCRMYQCRQDFIYGYYRRCPCYGTGQL